MVKEKVLLLLVLASVAWPVVSFGADANAVKDLFAQAQAHVDDENDDNDQSWLAAGDIYRQIAAADIGGDDGLKAQERLIWLYTRHEKPTQARAAYAELMANFSANENLVATMENELISAFRDSGDFKTSLEMYEYLIAQSPDQQKMLRISAGKAKCYLGLGYDANATSEVEAMLSRHANDERLPATVYDLAHECRQQKKWDKAREFFVYYVANWPGNKKAMEAQRHAAKASIKLGDDKAADTAIEKLIADYADNDKIGYEVSELADDFAANGNSAKAVELYSRVVERWPQSEWAT
jgi:TolA-binding protein